MKIPMPTLSSSRSPWSILVVAIWLLSISTPVASANDLAPFFGIWEGGTVSASDPRATFVEISGTSHGGFNIFWRNYSVSVSADGVVNVDERDRQLEFLPTSQGNWRATNLEEPTSATATMDGGALNITIRAVTEEGLLEQQHYSRTISGATMVLDFRREVGGETRRALTAMFVRSR